MKASEEVEIDINIPVILIDIARRYHEGISALELYEATRGAWRTGTKREAVKYAFAVSENIIREIYEIDSWHRAGSTPYRIKPFTSFAIDGRWEFLGRLAPLDLRMQFKGKSVAKYTVKHLHNEVLYLHCE